MMRSIFKVVACVSLMLSTVGCAGGPSYSDTAAKAPALATGQGRIFFYRDGSIFGAAIQPHVSLNDVEVGRSVPGGFFYLDRPAGNFDVTCVTEGVQSLKISLSSGETRYVRTRVSMGLGIGHVTPYLEDATTAMDTLKDCHYTGD